MDRDLQVDVAIVGAGYTGLWTAYYLHRADPTLRIAILESEIAGFGASGRNGGWCSALFAAEPSRLAREHGQPAALAMQRAMQDTVDEVGKVSADEGIDCHFVKGGTTRFATQPAHAERMGAEVAAGARDSGSRRTTSAGSTRKPQAVAYGSPARLVPSTHRTARPFIRRDWPGDWPRSSSEPE